MIQKLAENILYPIARRIGSAAGGYLIGLGVSETVLIQTEIIMAAAAAIGVDLIASYVNRNKVSK
jgi:hypothetical protein